MENFNGDVDATATRICEFVIAAVAKVKQDLGTIRGRVAASAVHGDSGAAPVPSPGLQSGTTANKLSQIWEQLLTLSYEWLQHQQSSDAVNQVIDEASAHDRFTDVSEAYEDVQQQLKLIVFSPILVPTWRRLRIRKSSRVCTWRKTFFFDVGESNENDSYN